MEPDEHLPSEPAQYTGRYDELNVFGTPTGLSIAANKGDALPSLPRGFMWRHVPALEW
jgi:hypothetical protein